MKTSFFISTLCTLLLSCTLLLCSQEDMQQLFKDADKGMYENILETIKKSPLPPQDIITARDSNDNSIISAAIKAYPQATKQYGDKKAAQMLFEMLTLLLSKLSKDQAVQLLNIQNKASMTALFTAAQLGLPLKIIDLLHGYGAIVETQENKKASTNAKDPYTKRILQEWENVEGDSINIPSGQRIQ